MPYPVGFTSRRPILEAAILPDDPLELDSKNLRALWVLDAGGLDVLHKLALTSQPLLLRNWPPTGRPFHRGVEMDRAADTSVLVADGDDLGTPGGTQALYQLGDTH